MKKVSLKIKLLVAFLAVGLIPFGVISAVSYIKSRDALSNQAFSQLEGVRGIKKNQIENFFEEGRGNMDVLVEMVATLHGRRPFRNCWRFRNSSGPKWKTIFGDASRISRCCPKMAWFRRPLKN